MNTSRVPFEPVSQEQVEWPGTEPLPANAYFDPGYFELERKAVFQRSWLQIGHVCALPEGGLRATPRDVHCEDRDVIDAGQRGLGRGFLKHIHFQTQDVLCRHLYKTINSTVEAYKAETNRTCVSRVLRRI